MTLALRGGTHLTLESLVAGGRELLVGSDEVPEAYRVHGERGGITFLGPWANRLREGAPDGAPADGEGVPIHGLPGDWQVDGDVAIGRYGWPAPHVLRVRFAWCDPVLTVETELRAERLVPVAFGWHPFLRPPGDRAGWLLEQPSRVRLGLDERGLPTGAREHLPAASAPLGDRTFDDAFAGLPDDATWRCGGIEVRHLNGLPAAQLFAPGDCDLVGIEPMAAPVDGLRTADRAMWARAVWRLSA